jgi:hypothetical protein
MRRHQGDVSLATAFFAQLLQAAAKEQQGVNLGSSIGAQKLVTKIAKDVQKKTAGSGWGAGAMIDAHMGAHLPHCGGRVNNQYAGGPAQEAGADRAMRHPNARAVTAG